MTNYKVTNLGSTTPQADRGKLEMNLKALGGVETVKLHPERSEISVSWAEGEEPKQETIAAAVAKAGFTLGAKN